MLGRKRVTFGLLHDVAYKLVDEPEREIIVSTTRPETVFGDRAIGVHPDDPRYKVSLLTLLHPDLF